MYSLLTLRRVSQVSKSYRITAQPIAKMPYKKTVLKNGLRIITVPLKDNPTVTVYCLVEAGSKYENKKINGISHFLEHMCFKGTVRRTRDEIAYELDSIGASNNAFTSREYTGYYAKASKKHASKILDIVSDIYLNSTFPEDEMQKEKGVVTEEIKMYEDQPQSKVGDVLMQTLYGNQPAGWTITGTPEHIKSLRRQELVDYHEKYYVPSATTVVVAGTFDEKKILKEIEKIFGGLKKRPRGTKLSVKEKQKKPAAGTFFKKTDQTHFALALRTFDQKDKRHPALAVLDNILGGGMSSRLFKKMRDELGICYYIGSGVSTMTDHGFVEIAAGAPRPKLELAIKEILLELKKLKEELVPEKELKKVKDYIIGHLYMGLESSKSFASYYGFQEALRDRIYTPEEWEKLIKGVSAEDIRRLAREIFKTETLNLAVVGPIKEKKGLEKLLKL